MDCIQFGKMLDKATALVDTMALDLIATTILERIVLNEDYGTQAYLMAGEIMKDRAKVMNRLGL